MSKSATATTAMWLLVVAIMLYALGTLPAAAQGAPAPQTQEQPKNHVNPDGTAVLYIYPHTPLLEGDQILHDPRSVPAPEDELTDSPFEAAKDPRTWA